MATDWRVYTIIKVLTVDFIGVWAAHFIIRNALSMTFLLIRVAAERVTACRLANVLIMVRTAVISTVAAAAWGIVDHSAILTALIGGGISVPELIIFTALFLVATFLGVWVMVGAVGLSLLGIRERSPIIEAVPIAVELVILATPLIAVEDLAVTSGEVVKRFRVWVVVSVATL